MSAGCGNCRHARPDANNPTANVFFCHRYPPTAQAVVLPTPPDVRNPQGGIGVQVLRTRPTVTVDDGCGEWSVAPPRLSTVK